MNRSTYSDLRLCSLAAVVHWDDCLYPSVVHMMTAQAVHLSYLAVLVC